MRELRQWARNRLREVCQASEGQSPPWKSRNMSVKGGTRTK